MTCAISRDRKQLKAAEEMRRAQTLTVPPTDTPWSFFDVAELCLYLRNEDGFIEQVKAGIDTSNAAWQPQTFHNSLKTTLVDSGIDLPGLKDGIRLLDEAATKLAEQ